MVGIISKPDTTQKLEILSEDAKYDLACACGTNRGDTRRRGGDGRWIYPVTLPNGGQSVLFKTLVSNVCTNDCKYCPLRQEQDIRRCSLSPEETAAVFLDYHRQRKVFGLFLTSGVIGSPDATMDRLTATARLLRRRHGFQGYIHLKIIPGAGFAAIDEALGLASAVSLNIETPGAANLARLSSKKDYLRDIIDPIKHISQLTARGSRFEKVKQTTQFIVGPAGESDREIVKYMWGLYDRLRLHRIYFSAYQKGLGDASLPAEQPDAGGEPDAQRPFGSGLPLRLAGIPSASSGQALPALKEQGQGVPNRVGPGPQPRNNAAGTRPPPSGVILSDRQPGAAVPPVGEPQDARATPFLREHRLYQVDFLMRQYGFRDTDIAFDARGQLSLESDPKEVWAANHPEFFPVDVNRGTRMELLRVPGLGPVTVNRLLQLRRAQRIGRLEEVGKMGVLLRKARPYLAFGIF